MEKDISNYSPTVMFRGTPCMYLIIYNLHCMYVNANYIRKKINLVKTLVFYGCAQFFVNVIKSIT